jgi:hypothetical protein
MRYSPIRSMLRRVSGAELCTLASLWACGEANTEPLSPLPAAAAYSLGLSPPSVLLEAKSNLGTWAAPQGG